MKPATISIASIVGTLGIVATIGFAQPDGIDPPAGPVSDTQPSLTSISQQLSDLKSSTYPPPNLKYVFAGIDVNPTQTKVLVPSSEADYVRIKAVFVTSSVTNMLVGESEDVVAIIGGSALQPASASVKGSNQFDFGGLRVPTPVKFRTDDPNTGSLVTLLYWIEE